LRAVRDVIGRTPLAVTFDLHAHLGAPQLDLFDVAVGYKTHPHVDLYETGDKALRLLDRMVAGRARPLGALAKIPAILPSINMRTTDGPMAETVAIAREIERERGLLDISVFGGFSYGDTPFAGGSILVHADGDRAAAERAAADVAAAMAARLDRFYLRLPEPDAAIEQALAGPPGAIALVEGSDNPGSGGIGDTTGLFSALVARRPDVPTVFAFFTDPAVVARAHAGGAGARLDVRLGGRIAPAFGAPVALSLTVERVTDGQFRNVGPMATGSPTNLGRTALLREGTLRVIVTEQCVTPNDPGFFALHGIDLAEVRLLGVKAKNHFRAGFRDRVVAMIDVDTAGPAALDLRRFDFRLAPAALRRA
jgi:microcystin degradation protein MlrC